MIVHAATGTSMFQYQTMQWILTLVLVVFLIVFVALVVIQYRTIRRDYLVADKFDPRGISLMFVGIGLSLIVMSALVYATIGRPLTTFMTEELGMEYYPPTSFAFWTAVVGVVVIACAGLIAIVAHKSSHKTAHSARVAAATRTAANR